MNICQTIPATLVLECQSFMVDTKLVQNSGMQVVDMDAILLHVVAVFIRRAIAAAGLNPTTCHPDRKAARMVVTSEAVLSQFALAIIRTAKFTAPDNKRVFQQTALFEILDQGC